MMCFIYSKRPESCLSENFGELYNRSDMVICVAIGVLLRTVVVLFLVDVLQVFVNLARCSGRPLTPESRSGLFRSRPSSSATDYSWLRNLRMRFLPNTVQHGTPPYYKTTGRLPSCKMHCGCLPK